MKNETITQLWKRKSIRSFTQKDITPEEKQEILLAAMQAPSAGNQQLYTILDITSDRIKEELVITCDHQPMIAKAKMVLIFCADCKKWYDGFRYAGAGPRKPGAGDLMLAVCDAMIAAQNAVVAAESMGIEVLYDVAHNIAKKERHDVDGKSMDVLVHRKGATRAFAAGRSEITMRYRNIGQPVIIPGDMCTGTYILVGRPGSMKETFGSSCHGAGRVMSRKKAISSITADSIRTRMSGDDIYLRSGSDEGLVEEAPQAYKDVSQVVSVVCDAGLTGKVARMRPIGVIKG